MTFAIDARELENVYKGNVATLSQAGVKVRIWWSIAVELQEDWRLDEAKAWPMARSSTSIFPLGATCSIRIQRTRGTMVPPEQPIENNLSVYRCKSSNDPISVHNLVQK